jgi:lysophospholipase L1-like esterase
MKSIWRTFLMVLPLLAAAFGWGVFVGHFETFPFSTLRGLKHSLWDTAAPVQLTFDDTHGRIEIACPRSAFVIVAIGQSNAGNAVPPLVRRSDAPVYDFYRGRCFVAEDPLLGTAGDQGSIWTPLAQDLAADGLPIVLITGAVWGSKIAQWLPEGDGYWTRIARELKQARETGLRPELIIWLQGEADAAAGTSRQTYRHALATLIDMSRAPSASTVNRPAWIIFQATFCGASAAGAAEIRAAQIDAISEAEGIYFGMDTDTLGAQYRYDGCHFNAAGRNLIVNKISNVIREKNLLHAERIH